MKLKTLMNTTLIKTTVRGALAALLVLTFTPPQARALDPQPGGGYPNQNTAEDDDALFSPTTSADNTAMGFDALDSNTIGSDNTVASWIWRRAGSLNTARAGHTAMLLRNRNVLVAGGVDSSFSALASTEKGGKLVS